MLVKPQSTSIANIKVVGIGGAGGNAINNMISNYDIEGVEFIAVNTDAQALANNSAEIKIQIGEELTRGLGSGGNPQIGKKAAEESVDLLHEHLAGADMVFLTCGMGGGTGTGAAPVIAGIAKNLGALTIAIVEKPFNFEGRRRQETASSGIGDIKDKVDTLIIIPNQKLIDVVEKNLSFLDAMKKVDDVLAQAVKSISQLITQPGMINVDYADIKAIMQNAGTALMGMGTASGDDRAEVATKAAMSSPLLEISIDGAKGVLFNVIGSKDMSMHEIDEVAKLISAAIDPDANVIFGAAIDQELKDEIQVTILATGFETGDAGKPKSKAPAYAYSDAYSYKTVNDKPEKLYQENNLPQETIETEPIKEPTKSMNPVKIDSESDFGDEDFETPSFMRRKKDY
ncbi:MAG: cell division protein FtsZ [bacterium]